MNPMQLSVHEFLVKHLGAKPNGWPNSAASKASSGTYNKFLLIWEEVKELAEALDIEPGCDDSGARDYNSWVDYRSIDRDLPDHTSPYYSNQASVANAAKELCDLLYVVFNLAEELELDIEPFFEQVHRSNMTKTPAALSPNKKILKGPDYVSPRMNELLKAYREGYKFCATCNGMGVVQSVVDIVACPDCKDNPGLVPLESKSNV